MVKDYSYYYTLPEEQYAKELALWFYGATKQELNLENPQTYNEKLQWMKLYDSTPIKSQLADKYRVREWVKERIGEEYLIPLLGVWKSFDEIDFDALPQQFVLKANHGCGYNYIVSDKNQFDKEDARQKFDIWMNQNFAFRNGLELHYRDIEPCIIAEKYIQNNGNDLYDYKVFCFSGKAEHIMFLSERKKGLKMAFFDLEWNKMPFVYNYPRNEEEIPKPKNLDVLIQLAEKLAQGFPQVRVDFYCLDDGSYKFGEMTFTSAGGRALWNIPEHDLKYGSLIKLPEPYTLKKRKPIVSVIIPAYNAAKTIRECLDSLLIQSLKDIEIICVDDGSEDNTIEILNEYRKKDSRIVVLQQKNQYAGVARNNGLEIARGDYVMFLDADDFFHPDMLMEMVRKGIQQRADIVVCGALRYHDTEKTMTPASWMLNMKLVSSKACFSAEDIPERIFNFTAPAPWNKMFRRDFVQKQNLFFQDTLYANDLRFTMTALAMASRISVVDRELVYYRVGQKTNLQSVKSVYPLIFLDALKSFKEQLIVRNKMEMLSRSYLNLVWSICLSELKTSDGEAYERKYQALKNYGCKELGLDELEEGVLFSKLRYNQLKAILNADVMIRII